MLKLGWTIAVFVVSAMVFYSPVHATENTIELDNATYQRLEYLHVRKGKSRWTMREIKTLFSTLKKDGKLDSKEQQVIKLILGSSPFTIRTKKSAGLVSRVMQVKLAPLARVELAKEIDMPPRDAYFGDSATGEKLLSMDDDRLVWPKQSGQKKTIYVDITTLDNAFVAVRWISNDIGINPTVSASEYRFNSSAPAMEGDLINLLSAIAAKTANSTRQIKWEADCRFREPLATSSRRIVTQVALDTCLNNIFGSAGDPINTASLNRGLMLRQIHQAYDFGWKIGKIAPTFARPN